MYIPDRLKEKSEYYYGNLKNFELGFIECLNELALGGNVLDLDNITDNIISNMNINEESINGKMKIEIIKEFVEELKNYLNCEANEINCSFIEGGVNDE